MSNRTDSIVLNHTDSATRNSNAIYRGRKPGKCQGTRGCRVSYYIARYKFTAVCIKQINGERARRVTQRDIFNSVPGNIVAAEYSIKFCGGVAGSA